MKSILNINRKEMLGTRTSSDFVKTFDSLCLRLGHRRSTVIRFALRRFVNEHLNNTENLYRTKSEMI
jgi:hypothetical protein